MTQDSCDDIAIMFYCWSHSFIFPSTEGCTVEKDASAGRSGVKGLTAPRIQSWYVENHCFPPHQTHGPRSNP